MKLPYALKRFLYLYRYSFPVYIYIEGIDLPPVFIYRLGLDHRVDLYAEFFPIIICQIIDRIRIRRQLLRLYIHKHQNIQIGIIMVIPSGV